MGVDCKVYLPGNVRASEVAELIGILLGCTKTKMKLQAGRDSWYVHVADVKLEGSPNIPQVAAIKGPDFWCTYHFECGDERCFDGTGRLVMFRSRPRNVAIATRLVKFFGGRVDYQDCDDIDVDYEQPAKTLAENGPEDGEAWQKFQKRMYEVPPLTKDEIDDAVQFAAYKPGDD